MTKILMEMNRIYRLEKVQKVKDQMQEGKMSLTEKVLLFSTVLFAIYFGIHFVIYLVRNYV